MLRKILICLVGVLVWLGGSGCSTLISGFDPFQDLVDHVGTKERERSYKERGYDSETARRAAEEDATFEWFQEQTKH